MSEIESSQDTKQVTLEIEPKPEVDQIQSVSMRPFFIAWSGQAISLFGSQLVRFAIVWWLTVQTGSATVLATATIMIILPQVILNPFAGSYVDRWNRKHTIIISDALIAVTIIALAFLFAIEIVDIWTIFAVTFIGAIVGAFHGPAFTASVSMMVPREHLSRVGGLNQALSGAVTIIAPPTGALLVELMPIYNVLAIDVLTAIVAIVTIAAIHVPQPPNNVDHKESSVIKDMAEGFRFLKGWPGALRLMLIAMIMNFTLSPAMSLLPIMASVFFNGDATTLATLQSAIAIGIFTGGIFISAWGGTKKRIHTSLGGACFLGVAFLIIGFITPNDFWIAVALFLFGGFMASVANGPLSAIFQATIPPEMQGRVFSVLSSGTSLMTPIGLAFAGPIADFFGIQFMFIVAGLVTAVAAIAAFFSKPLMEIEDNHRKPTEDVFSNPYGIDNDKLDSASE